MAERRITVRDARDQDADAVGVIFDHYVAHSTATFETAPRPAAVWRERWATLRAAGWPVLVGELDAAVLGFAYAGPWRPQAAYRHTVETTVYLAPGHTGARHGVSLLAAVLERAAANGARQAIAVIADANPASVALHRRLGFVDAGTLRAVGEKFGRSIDTALLQRELRGNS